MADNRQIVDTEILPRKVIKTIFEKSFNEITSRTNPMLETQ